MSPERVHQEKPKKRQEAGETNAGSEPEDTLDHEEIEELLDNIEHLDEEVQEVLLNNLDWLENIPSEWDG